MKLYEFLIKPKSGIGTPLKGDTLFGHFCWQAHYDPGLLKGGLDGWIDRYSNQPFLVLSSAWPKLTINRKGYYVLKRPDLPLPMLFPFKDLNREERMSERKAVRNKKWFLLEEDLVLNLNEVEYKSEAQLALEAYEELTHDSKRMMRGKENNILSVEFLRQHNTIDRRFQTTGEGLFAPYSMPSIFFYPEMELAVFALIDEEATDAERVSTALERIGSFGFGRDASTGLGRFDLAEVEEKALPNIPDADACYTLAPAVPEKNRYRDYYFQPFTRFGRHGDALATSVHPFKNPIIMTDEGAVLVPADAESFNRPYVGRAVRNISKIQPGAVAQGYAPYLPLKLEIQS